jgi:hypothetical protein
VHATSLHQFPTGQFDEAHHDFASIVGPIMTGHLRGM